MKNYVIDLESQNINMKENFEMEKGQILMNHYASRNDVTFRNNETGPEKPRSYSPVPTKSKED